MIYFSNTLYNLCKGRKYLSMCCYCTTQQTQTLSYCTRLQLVITLTAGLLHKSSCLTKTYENKPFLQKQSFRQKKIPLCWLQSFFFFLFPVQLYSYLL